MGYLGVIQARDFGMWSFLNSFTWSAPLGAWQQQLPHVVPEGCAAVHPFLPSLLLDCMSPAANCPHVAGSCGWRCGARQHAWG